MFAGWCLCCWTKVGEAVGAFVVGLNVGAFVVELKEGETVGTFVIGLKVGEGVGTKGALVGAKEGLAEHVFTAQMGPSGEVGLDW